MPSDWEIWNLLLKATEVMASIDTWERFFFYWNEFRESFFLASTIIIIEILKVLKSAKNWNFQAFNKKIKKLNCAIKYFF